MPSTATAEVPVPAAAELQELHTMFVAMQDTANRIEAALAEPVCKAAPVAGAKASRSKLEAVSKHR